MTKKYYQHPQYKTVYSESFPTPQGRFAWVSLVTPKDPPPPQPGQAPGTPRYEVSLILPKKNPKVDTFIALLKEECKGMLETFNKTAKAKLSIDTFMQDGDNFDMEKYPYYADSWILVARNAKKPTIVDDAKGEIPPETIKGGMSGKLMVTLIVTSHGLSFKCEVVQFLKDDGTRFGGASRNTQALVDMLDSEDEAGEETEAEDTPLEQEAAKVSAPAKAQAAVQKGKAALARL